MSLIEDLHDATELARAATTMECPPYLLPGEAQPTRLARALALCQQDAVAYDEHGPFTICGKTATYFVDPLNGCSCKAATFQGPWCYHRVAAVLYDRWQSRVNTAYISPFTVQQGDPWMEATTVLTTPDVPLSSEEVYMTPTIGDIADPPQPIGDIAAQAKDRAESPTVNPNTVEGQTMMSVDQAMFKISEHAATVLSAIDKSWDSALRVLNHNNNAILCLKEALQSWAPHTPYAVGVDAISPSGYPMVFRIEALTQDEFLTRVSNMMAFLASNGFTPNGAQRL